MVKPPLNLFTHIFFQFEAPFLVGQSIMKPIYSLLKYLTRNLKKLAIPTTRIALQRFRCTALVASGLEVDRYGRYGRLGAFLVFRHSHFRFSDGIQMCAGWILVCGKYSTSSAMCSTVKAPKPVTLSPMTNNILYELYGGFQFMGVPGYLHPFIDGFSMDFQPSSYRMGHPFDSVQLPQKSGWILWFMVDITIVNRVYKPTNITGGHHPVLIFIVPWNIPSVSYHTWRITTVNGGYFMVYKPTCNWGAPSSYWRSPFLETPRSWTQSTPAIHGSGSTGRHRWFLTMGGISSFSWLKLFFPGWRPNLCWFKHVQTFI